MTEILLWVDVETTGLDCHQDYLLQVAAIPTDLDGNMLGGEYESVLYYPESLVDVIKTMHTVEYVREMHNKTGLWDRLPQGKKHKVVDQELLDFIKQYAPEPRQARLAGNSVRLDLNFLEVDLPYSYAHLHYRSVDVSALAYVMADCWKIAPGYFEKKKTHNALDDIKESIAEYRWLRTHI